MKAEGDSLQNKEPLAQYILARSQVTMPWKRSVNKSDSAVAARVARTANTVKGLATKVHCASNWAFANFDLVLRKRGYLASNWLVF